MSMRDYCHEMTNNKLGWGTPEVTLLGKESLFITTPYY